MNSGGGGGGGGLLGGIGDMAQGLVGGSLGAPISIAGLALGGGPKPVGIPTLPPLEIGREQQQAIQGNLDALPAAEQLASRVNQFSQAELQKMLDIAFPGASEQVGKNISNLLRGEIPEDVGRAVQRSAAGRALAGGFAGSGLGGNLLARDLGLTSLQLQQQGAGQLQALAPVMTAPRFSVASMFMTPTERINFVLQDRAEQFQRNLLANQAAAADRSMMENIGSMMIASGAQIAGTGFANAASRGGSVAVPQVGTAAPPSGTNSYYQPILTGQQATNSMLGLQGIF